MGDGRVGGCDKAGDAVGIAKTDGLPAFFSVAVFCMCRAQLGQARACALARQNLEAAAGRACDVSRVNLV